MTPKIMTVRAPARMQEKLKEYAEESGITRNALIIQILWEWLSDKEKTL